jgi:hypothetical protein
MTWRHELQNENTESVLKIWRIFANTLPKQQGTVGKWWFLV